MKMTRADVYFGIAAIVVTMAALPAHARRNFCVVSDCAGGKYELGAKASEKAILISLLRTCNIAMAPVNEALGTQGRALFSRTDGARVTLSGMKSCDCKVNYCL